MLKIFQRKGTRGNVALIFSLLALPMVAMVAGGIDLARVNSAKAELQGITDAAIISAARQSTDSSDEVKVVADTVLKAHISNTKLRDVTSSIGNSTGTKGLQLDYTASGKLDTFLAKAIGRDYIVISATSSAIANSADSEVVFVLDTTGSMASNNKMNALKAAVNQVLDGMAAKSGSGDNNIKIGIVPFNTQVRLTPDVAATYVDWGYAYNSQDCISVAGQNYWPNCQVQWWNADIICNASSNKSTCISNLKYYDKAVYWSSNRWNYDQIAVTYEPSGSKYIVRKHTMRYWWTDSTCSGYVTNETGTYCTGWSGGSSGLAVDTQTNYTNQTSLTQYSTKPSGYLDTTKVLKWTPWLGQGFGASAAASWNYTTYNSNTRTYSRPATASQKGQWLGCIADRPQNYDVSADAANVSIASSLYPARVCEFNELQTIMGLTTDINAAKAKISALQPAGYTNITIGIQWGMEVLSPSVPFNSGAAFGDKAHAKYMIIVTDGYNTKNAVTTNVADIDARTKLACENAKAKGITVFVVRLEEGDTELLKQCATVPPYFYDLTSSAQLGDAMQDMFKSISKLRLIE